MRELGLSPVGRGDNFYLCSATIAATSSTTLKEVLKVNIEAFGLGSFGRQNLRYSNVFSLESFL
jgi:hypothetical protein